MRRREVITLLSGAAAAWPLAVAHAQQSERVRRIGVLQGQAADDSERQAYLAAFRKELERLGWTDGRNIRIDYRWSAGNAADAGKFAAELVGLTPDLIFTSGSASRLSPQRSLMNSRRLIAAPRLWSTPDTG